MSGMADVIEIGVPYEDILARKERVLAARRFEEPDRVPVLPAIAYRYLLPRIGVPFSSYYADPETMLRAQILGQRWLMENIRTDAYSITGAWTGAWTDFENTFEAGSLGCTVEFPDDGIPWVAGSWVRTEEDLRRLEAMDFVHGELNERQVRYRRAMMAVAERYPVRFRGGPVFYPGSNPSLTHTSDGPFGVAGDLMGQTELFMAVHEKPEFVAELLRIVTDKLIAYLDFCWTEEGLADRDLAWTDDLAVGLSEESYRQLVLPEEKRLRFHFDGRASLHMCGRTDHLLEVFRDDLAIDEFQGFGYQVDLERVAAVMGGRVVLLGNVNPMLVREGPPERVREATRACIEKLAPFKGYIVQDGANIPPGTPPEHINAMMEASELYGRYK
jgi:uroporphyrinogen-III decarboxylase